MFARTGGRGAAQPEKKVVDLKADVMYPIEFRDTSAVCLVGNVAFYHSGAVITCDSAVRYSEKHMECFGENQKDVRKMVMDSYHDIEKGKGRDYKEFFAELESRYRNESVAIISGK